MLTKKIVNAAKTIASKIEKVANSKNADAETIKDLLEFYYMTARGYFLIEDYEEAIIHYQKYETAYDQYAFDKIDELQNVLIDMVACYTILGKFKESLARHNKLTAMPLNPSTITTVELINYYLDVSNIHQNLLQHDEALSYLEQIQKILEKNTNIDSLVWANYYAHLASAYLGMKQYDIALKYYKRSETIFEKKQLTTDPTIAQLYAEMAEVYLNTNQPTLSLQYLKRELVIREKKIPKNHDKKKAK